MDKKRWVIAISLIALAFIVSLFFDKPIVKAVSSLQTSFINQAMVLISYLGIVLVLIAIVLCLFLIHDRKKIIPLIVSFSVTEIVVILLKIIIQRMRPFEALGLNTLAFLVKKTYTTWDLSFPSAHAAVAFAALPFFEGKMKYYWFAFACLVCFSRVFFALHYLSDVIAGAVIGFMISTLIVELFKMKKGIIR